MKLRHLRYFDAAVEAKNVSRAAERQGIVNIEFNPDGNIKTRTVSPVQVSPL